MTRASCIAAERIPHSRRSRDQKWTAVRVAWKLIGLTVTAVVWTGCATPDTVMLLNPATNELARCAAGYSAFLNGQGYRTQEECIADYRRKGYEPAGSTAGK